MTGMPELKDKSIIVCGIVRNAAKGLRRNIPVIDTLCSYFGEYRIVFYENDSKDTTKEVLAAWQKTNPKRICILSEDYDTTSAIPTESEVKGNPFFSERRIQKMADLRNRYMDYIEKHQWNADYLMVVDMDVQRIDLKGVLSSFADTRGWDAVTAYGYSTSPKLRKRYHDTYALTAYGDEGNPQTEEKIKRLAEKYALRKGEEDWIRVFSAFGGMAIYRYERVKGLRYQVLPNKDSRVEVRCEHFSLYWQMAKQGEIEVYINPKMKIEYQRLSLGIIWRSLRRMIGI